MLVIAPAANAQWGIVGAYDFSTTDRGVAPGTFDNDSDFALNSSGAGGADPGDIYTGDPGSSVFGNVRGKRIQQFAANGDFKRLWGQDVVASGPGNADESQALSVFATAGTFTLTFGGETTGPIAFDADASVVQGELNGLPSIGGVGAAVTVSGGPGNATGSAPYLVTFGGVQGGADQPPIQVGGSGLTGGASVSTTNQGAVGFEICNPSNGDTCKNGEGGFGIYPSLAVDQQTGDVLAINLNAVARHTATGEFLRTWGHDVVQSGFNDSTVNEQQQVTVQATGGSFSLRVFVPDQGQTSTNPIPFDAPTSVIEDEIEALPGFGSDVGGAVTVTGGPGDATGSSPYVIEFDGLWAGDDVRPFNADNINLSGTPNSVTVDQDFSPGGAPEVCTPTDVCKQGETNSDVGGAFASLTNSDIAVVPVGAPNAGNVLVTDPGNDRVQEFTPDGVFVRTFGWDVIAPGSPNDASGFQEIRVGANGGTYTLTFNGDTTGSMPYDASAATVESELNSLPSISGVGGSVTVKGPPPPNSSTHLHWVTFGGSLAGNPGFIEGDESSLTQTGFNDPSISIGSGFEVCVAGSGDTCKAGTQGTGVGQFAAAFSGVVEDSTGKIYVTEGVGSNDGHRVQEFTPAGGQDLTPSVFGENEEQEVTVKATGGDFRLGIVDSQGARSQSGANTGANSTLVEEVVVAQGEFLAGQPIGCSVSAPGTYITQVGPEPQTLHLNQGSGTNTGNGTVCSPNIIYTPDLSAGATAGQVEAALNALGPIAAKDGHVSVTGGPADATGSSPFVVTFDGPEMATDPPSIEGISGTNPLTGGTGVGANEVTVQTTTPGGPNGSFGDNDDEAHDAPVDTTIGSGDEVLVLKNYRMGWDTCDSGLPSWRDMYLAEYNSSGQLTEKGKPCSLVEPPDQGDDNFRLDFNPLEGRVYAFDPNGFRRKIYVYGEVGQQPDLTVNAPSNISASGVTISGEVDPNGPGPVNAPIPSATTYRVEYKRTSESNWEVYAPDVSVGTGDSPVPFSVGVSGLTPKVEYEARVIVTKPFGFEQVIQQTAPFETLAAAPVINAFSSSHITANSADLHALINPLGTATSYHFEYGKTPAYGQSTPETDIGDSLTPVSVTDHIENLDPVVYHFRVVATNSEGTTVSTNQTFNFYPEPCPNSAVRQQTGSNSLPDCRAYELVSPEFAGSASLIPGGPNSPEASNPSRFAYAAGLGSIPGPWNPPNALGDPYMATRTSTGWQTYYIGIPGDEAGATTGPPNGEGVAQMEANLSMDRVIGWNPGHQGFTCCAQTGSMAPYVFGPQGSEVDRWPTNVESVVGGLKSMSCWLPGKPLTCGPPGGFAGDLRPSADFDHYFFSSGNVSFAPGGQTSGIGSVYDNEIATGEVSIASKDTNGDDIEPEPGVTADDYMALPAADRDGSHILMAASATGISGDTINQPMPFPCGWGDGGFDHSLSINDCPDLLPSHLYMRVDGGVTYDVSQGNIVDFQGMTGDGSKVFFTSDEQLTGDDNDTSTDLFMWGESTDSISLVTIGTGGVGDSDACNASWTDKCGIEIADPDTSGGFLNAPFVNSWIAHETGDIYFYSPEQFVGANGIPGRRNLYVARGGDGDIQYVATLEPTEQASRMQVTPDGNYAAFITPSQLTPYDNAGFDMMYRYDAESNTLRCESCVPSGDPPTNDANGSEDGLYISDDGRTFFDSHDALVAQDTNGLNDVYEFVSGKPQLITTGIAEKDSTRLGPTGLIGVSSNGVDVYFSTTETLVEEDGNGAFLKFYDARTNGGFPNQPEAAPCAAADECHGDGTEGESTPRFGSTANLGQAGNVRVNRCTRLGRTARVFARRAKADRNRIRRATRSSSRGSRRKIVRLRKRARALTRRARRTSTRAKRCRATVRRARANRRAGK